MRMAHVERLRRGPALLENFRQAAAKSGKHRFPIERAIGVLVASPVITAVFAPLAMRIIARNNSSDFASNAQRS
jgi:hypothetical protein